MTTRSRENVMSEKSIDARGKEILEDLFKSRELLLDQQILAKLKKSLPDEKVIEAVFDYYKKKLDYINRKANKFKQAILRKYTNLTTSQIIEKAKKYTKKYDLSEGEFRAFINSLLSDTTQPYHSMFNIPSTPMARTLGYNVNSYMGDSLVISGESDQKDFKEIMEIEKASKALHSRLIMQSLMYTDCHPDAMSGIFDSTKYNSLNYVHPVVAALFLPKVPYLEERMLLTSIAGIIKAKSEGKPIMTQPEFELYWDLITDPAQSVCVTENNKVLGDLKERTKLQVKLWESVMNLRLGRYYADDMIGFMNVIESCRSSIFDAPDLVFSHDEGTILRRILNAFALRPTVVSISSLGGFPMTAATFSLPPASYTQVTTIPMINMRLPQNIGIPGYQAPTVSLNDALNQPQWFIEGKTPVAKTQSIIHSRDVLFFYVDRRFKSFNYAALNRPFVLTGLPPSLSGLDTINETKVDFSLNLRVGNDDFLLRSVVFIELSKIAQGKNMITGCSTGIVIAKDLSKGQALDVFCQYDPQGAGYTHILADGSTQRYAPVSFLPDVSTSTTVVDRAFFPLASTRGCIFMFVKQH